MEGIIEYIDVPWDRGLLRQLHESVKHQTPRSYLECGAASWFLGMDEQYYKKWAPLLDIHTQIHSDFSALATGFNFSLTPKHSVPPHVDLEEKGSFYNVLLPVYGVANIEIYETRESELEFRHGMKHWKMIMPNFYPQKIGELKVDRPVLLNTKYLHSVNPIDTPRLAWCTRWVNLPDGLDFKSFKQRVEGVLGAS